MPERISGPGSKYPTGSASGRSLPVIPGASLLAITETARGIVVGCPGCGAQELFAWGDEPRLTHASADCYVFQRLVTADRLFVVTGERVG